MSDAAEFTKALKRFNVGSLRRVKSAVAFAREEVVRSVKYGSELTGAPGQPVDTSNLVNSWTESFPSQYEWLFATNVEYAIYIEHGSNDIAAFTLRSEVGGFHSVKLTIASWDRIAEFAARKASVGGLLS